jgi:hypothetical protein
MLNTYINNILVPEPKGFKDLTERLAYSTELSGYVRDVMGSVAFVGSGYNLLRGYLESDLCTDIVFHATKDNSLLFSAKIFLTDVDWLIHEREATCELTYDGWMSKIDHNKKIKCQLNVGRSKNDVAIFTNPITNFRIPDVDNLFVNDNTGKRGVYVYDAFKTLVQFMTDGEVDFRSDFLDYSVPAPAPESLCAIMTGKALRENAFTTFPTISFMELYDDINALFNLAFTYGEDASGKYIRIERKSYFKGQNVSAHLSDVRGVVQSLQELSFPAKVIFGSADQADVDAYLEELRFLSVLEEEYHLGGQCNLDTTLDLRLTTLISDPNIIQDVVPTGTHTERDYDKEVFIVAMDPADINRAFMSETPAATGLYYLNSLLTNEKVALRWFDQVPISIYAFLGAGGNGCYIGQTTPSQLGTEVAPLLLSRVFRPQQEVGSGFNNVNGNYVQGIDSFPNSGWNVSGLYPLGLMSPLYGGYYYAPFSLVYNFQAEIYFLQGSWTRIYAMVINPVGNVVEQSILLASQLSFVDPPEVVVGTGILNPFDNIHHVVLSGSVYMQQGWYIGIGIDSPIADVILSPSTFEVFDPLGGRWASFYEEDNFLMENRFKYPIAQDKWDAIKRNPNDVITFDNNDGTVRSAWLSEITRNVITGEAEVKINGKI